MRSKYGRHDPKAAENFIGNDPHDASMPIAYFVWVIKGDSKVWVVDTGFDRAEANKRGRHVNRTVGEAVALVGVNEVRWRMSSSRICTTTTAAVTIPSRVRAFTSKIARCDMPPGDACACRRCATRCSAES